MMGYINKRFGADPLSMFRTYARQLTLEKVLSSICFIAGLGFLIAAVLGVWRHFFTMAICIAVGIMISDEEKPDENKKRHKDK